MKRKNWTDGLFLAPGFLTYIIFMIVPVLMCFFYSFTNWDGFSPTYRMVGFENFIDLFKDDAFFNALKVTAIIMVVTVVIYNVLGIFLAVLLGGNTKLQNFSKSAIFLPTVISSVVVAFIWSYMIQTDGGVINMILGLFGARPVDFYSSPLMTIFMMSIIICWNGLGFFVVIYVATLSTIPAELFEACKIDGAGSVKTFFHVTLPLLMPGITINSILSIAGGLKQYDHVKVITGGGPGGATQTVTLFAVKEAFEYNLRGYSSAIILVLFFIIVGLSGAQLFITKRNEVEY